METTPQISIIVPVYNAADVIIRCVDALLAQTCRQMEVILVDDHGTDDSIERVRTHIAAHPRREAVRFVQTPVNSGPGGARNVGIEEARGAYVAFCDSDDYVEPDAYETLLHLALSHDADLCCCNALQEERGACRLLQNPHLDSGSLTMQTRHAFLTQFASYLWTFVYRRRMLLDAGLRFPPTRSAEDTCFLTSCLLLAERTAQTERPLYHYVIQPASLTQTRNAERYRQKMASFDALMDFAHQHGLYAANAAELDYIYIKKAYLLASLNYLTNAERPRADVLRALTSQLSDVVHDFSRNVYYRSDARARLLCVLLRRMPRLSCRLLPRAVRALKISV
ncbi:MAG: glycosyltransferase [Paludibacteraceae bacterium]|nr:glycosyltransferase [Paludibacteraceae bacterium]